MTGTLIAPVIPSSAAARPARAPAAIRQRQADHQEALRLPVAAARRAPPLGPDPPGQHVLDQAHHTDQLRNFGYAVARAYAGHTDRGSDAGATTTYVRATPSEVATALSALTGEPHPLAMPQEGSAC